MKKAVAIIERLKSMQMHSPGYVVKAVILGAGLGAWLASPAHASSRDGYYSHHLVPCATYAKHRKEYSDLENNAADRMYIAGWLSAYNYFTPNTYDILGHANLDAALSWLDGYCQKQPSANLETGIAAFTQAVYPGRLTAMPADPQASPPQPLPSAAPAPR